MRQFDKGVEAHLIQNIEKIGKFRNSAVVFGFNKACCETTNEIVSASVGAASGNGGVRNGGVGDSGVRDGGVRNGGVGGTRNGGVRDSGVRNGGVRDSSVRDGGVRNGGVGIIVERAVCSVSASSRCLTFVGIRKTTKCQDRCSKLTIKNNSKL